jgi:hypothetical protein
MKRELTLSFLAVSAAMLAGCGEGKQVTYRLNTLPGNVSVYCPSSEASSIIIISPPKGPNKDFQSEEINASSAGESLDYNEGNKIGITEILRISKRTARSENEVIPEDAAIFLANGHTYVGRGDALMDWSLETPGFLKADALDPQLVALAKRAVDLFHAKAVCDHGDAAKVQAGIKVKTVPAKDVPFIMVDNDEADRAFNTQQEAAKLRKAPFMALGRN